MSLRQPDNFAQELLVGLAQDVGRDDGEFIGTFWVVEAPQKVTQQFIIKVETESDLVGRLVAPFLRLEIKKPGVVLSICVFEDFTETRVEIRTVRQALKPAIGFDSPIRMASS